MIKGVIKSMPEHVMHYRAGVGFPREGREFLVDDAATTEAAKLHPNPANADDHQPVKPVVFHVVDEYTKKPVAKRGQLVDVPGQPLHLSADAYEYMLQASGVNLVFEPIGGVMDQFALQGKIIALESENSALKERLAELQKVKK